MSSSQPVIVSAADTHLGSSSNYGMRGPTWDSEWNMPKIWAEALKSIDQLIDLANEVEADYLTISGDIFDNGTPAPEIVAQFLDRLGRLDTAKVIVVDGNHDQQKIVSNHRTPIGAYLQEHRNVLRVAEGSEVFEHDGVFFALSPWQRVAGIKAQEHASLDLAETIKSLGDQIGNGPSIFLSHIVVDECTFDSGHRSSELLMGARGFESSVPTALLEAGPWATAQLGHIHKRQQLSDKVWYTGSTYKVSFGERDEKKGASVVRFQKDGSATVEFRPFDIRELHQLDLRDAQSRFEAPEHLQVIQRGDLVRLLINEEAEGTSEFSRIISGLEKVGINPDLSREAVRHSHGGTRVKGLGVDTDPISALRAYANQHGTDEDLLARALAEFDQITA